MSLASSRSGQTAFGQLKTFEASSPSVSNWRYLCIPAVGSDSKIPPFRDGEDGAF